jgi:diguanylate cyclase (GGDEF)-like protein/PAS domain S-box-containing protein
MPRSGRQERFHHPTAWTRVYVSNDATKGPSPTDDLPPAQDESDDSEELRRKLTQTQERVRVLEVQLARSKDQVRISTARRAARDIISERYALAAAGANDGMWAWELDSGDFYCSGRWRAVLGHPAQEFRTTPEHWLDRIHPSDHGEVQHLIDLHLDGKDAHFECEHRILHEDGAYRWFHCRGLAQRDSDGRPTLLAGSLSDITMRKLAELQLLHDATHDALTGLPNRVLFQDRLDHAIAQAERRRGEDLAVLFVDLDRFKNINDSYGHSVGDKLLQEVARRMLRAVRAADTVARIGGDEFTVLLEGLRHPREAHEVAHRIRTSVAKPMGAGDLELVITASVGIALLDDQAEGDSDLLRDADTAMYRAKGLGGGQMTVFQGAMRDVVVRNFEIETDLRRALGGKELALFYQPIYALPEMRLVGVEALVRWRRPDGVVLPGHFLPVARQSGLLPQLEAWVIEESCRQLQSWRRRELVPADMAVWINVSPGHLRRDDLLEELDAVLRVTRLSAKSIHFEITEDALLADSNDTAARIEALRERGVTICVDDFGTGFSSLSYLQRFPVDILKIDRSFVEGSGSDHGSSAIARAIRGLATGLGIRVVAEGVETAEQAQFVRDLGCDFAQGFGLCRPSEPDSDTLFAQPPQLL